MENDLEVDRALEALLQNRADLIAVGRGLIADPLWPKKVQERRFDDIVAFSEIEKFIDTEGAAPSQVLRGEIGAIGEPWREAAEDGL